MATIFRDSSVQLERPSKGLGLRLFPSRAPRPVAPPPPSTIDLISMLVSKLGISEQQAEGFVVLLGKVRDEAPAPHVLNHIELSAYHHILHSAIPARSSASPGSIHEMANRVLLEEGQSFKHGMTHDQCSVVISCS
jgi:hypothetical protein